MSGQDADPHASRWSREALPGNVDVTFPLPHRSLNQNPSIAMFPILTIVGGVITASPLIVAKKPNSEQLFTRIAPYQGFFGIGVLTLGILWLVRWLPHISMSFSSLDGAIVLAMIVLNILLGFLMGFGLLSGLLAKNETAKQKSAALIAKLTSVQIPLGLTAVLLGAASFVL